MSDLFCFICMQIKSLIIGIRHWVKYVMIVTIGVLSSWASYFAFHCLLTTEVESQGWADGNGVKAIKKNIS